MIFFLSVLFEFANYVHEFISSKREKTNLAGGFIGYFGLLFILFFVLKKDLSKEEEEEEHTQTDGNEHTTQTDHGAAWLG